jgi:hypothetical protein
LSSRRHLVLVVCRRRSGQHAVVGAAGLGRGEDSTTVMMGDVEARTPSQVRD